MKCDALCWPAASFRFHSQFNNFLFLWNSSCCHPAFFTSSYSFHTVQRRQRTTLPVYMCCLETSALGPCRATQRHWMQYVQKNTLKAHVWTATSRQPGTFPTDFKSLVSIYYVVRHLKYVFFFIFKYIFFADYFIHVLNVISSSIIIVMIVSIYYNLTSLVCSLTFQPVSVRKFCVLAGSSHGWIRDVIWLSQFV